jgi:hypothetical protein
MDMQWRKAPPFDFEGQVLLNCNALPRQLKLAPEFVGNLAEILADDVPIALGLEIIFL